VQQQWPLHFNKQTCEARSLATLLSVRILAKSAAFNLSRYAVGCLRVIECRLAALPSPSREFDWMRNLTDEQLQGFIDGTLDLKALEGPPSPGGDKRSGHAH